MLLPQFPKFGISMCYKPLILLTWMCRSHSGVVRVGEFLMILVGWTLMFGVIKITNVTDGIDECTYVKNGTKADKVMNVLVRFSHIPNSST